MTNSRVNSWWTASRLQPGCLAEKPSPEFQTDSREKNEVFGGYEMFVKTLTLPEFTQLVADTFQFSMSELQFINNVTQTFFAFRLVFAQDSLRTRRSK